MMLRLILLNRTFFNLDIVLRNVKSRDTLDY